MKEELISQINSYLTFKLGDELYAANVRHVINIVELSKITKVPRCPEYMLGIVNLRGMVLPVIDARKKFGLPQTEITINTCILVLEVVVHNDTVMVGALVDGVREVIEIDDKDITDPPTIGFNNKDYFITGVFKKAEEESFVMILDMDTVFSSDEIIAVNQASVNIEEVVK
jgi:purine-binding chemotaxis protein CheW